MSIDKDKIKHTAKLARISLDDKKIDNLSKDLSNIFKFIEKLNNANTDNVKPLSSILDTSLRSREDKVNDGNIRDQILENAPNKNEDFFIVPKVIE
ncbi:MAG: Asp-tRNA(Asn)/Glu-tRNA(Gln) amidotransferase subunit GatC [Pelagibacteraceae bacterium]|jgi:aspartyl-tRNA(Asn)/glutamyl-tRNA(Gln) amidotransferase subunit C|nr:Asp-tRNA(Asn)/Glu-tRNA(Gln) amidotransferase subunit GatC [Pelagibacteraceae bacterium]